MTPSAPTANASSVGKERAAAEAMRTPPARARADLTDTGSDQARALNSMLKDAGWVSKLTGGRPFRAVISPLTRCVLAGVHEAAWPHSGGGQGGRAGGRVGLRSGRPLLCALSAGTPCHGCASIPLPAPHSLARLSPPSRRRLCLQRCLHTASLVLSGMRANATVVEELCRETLGEDTCDARRRCLGRGGGTGGWGWGWGEM